MKHAPDNVTRSVRIMTELVTALTDLHRAGYTPDEIEAVLGDGSIPMYNAELHIKARVRPTLASVRYCYTTTVGTIALKRVAKLGKKAI